MLLFKVFLVEVFSHEMFLGESPMEYLFRKHYKWFFNTISDFFFFKVFHKFFQTKFIIQVLKMLETLYKITPKHTLMFFQIYFLY